MTEDERQEKINVLLTKARDALSAVDPKMAWVVITAEVGIETPIIGCIGNVPATEKIKLLTLVAQDLKEDGEEDIDAVAIH